MTHEEIAWRAHTIWRNYCEYAKRAGYVFTPDANWFWFEAERQIGALPAPIWT